MTSHSAILRAAVRRFIPDVLGFLVCGLYLTARIKGVTLARPQIDGFTNLTLFMTLGFVSAVFAIRRLLPGGMDVDGRRSLLAAYEMRLSSDSRSPQLAAIARPVLLG